MLEKIIKVIKEYKDVSIEINENTTLKELELDSLDKVELMMNLEDEFGVTLEMNEEMETVKSLMEAIQKAEGKE